MDLVITVNKRIYNAQGVLLASHTALFSTQAGAYQALEEVADKGRKQGYEVEQPYPSDVYLKNESGTIHYSNGNQYKDQQLTI